MNTTKEKINSVVWNACDSFRGSMDSSKYKDYILSLLFVKYLSDSYKEEESIIYEECKDNPTMLERKLQRRKFKLRKESTFDYLLSQKESSNIGELINGALQHIQNDNETKLGNIFDHIDFNDPNFLGNNKERNRTLSNLLDNFSNDKIDLSPSKLENQDVIGDAYEFLIAEFASDAGKKGGEFFTPSEVSTLLAKLVQAKESSTIYDPTCGSGSLLIKASKEVGNQNFRIFGQEKNSQTHALCRMNMLLHGIEDADIKWGDTIINPQHLENNQLKTFDIIVANPPFSLKEWGAEYAENDTYQRFKHYAIPPKTKGDYAFVIHMLASLAPQGRMGIVLPHGVLFRGSSEEKIRKKILENNLLDAVIGLPENLFYGTSIPACILIFKKDREYQDVLFIDASKEFKKNKNQNKLTEEHITKILTTYQNRQEIEKYSHIATMEEIQENDYNLNIPRYVDTFEEEEEIDIPSTLDKIAKLDEEISKTQAKMDNYLKELGLV
ncbi:type I restriction-modification system subunit M [Helicobacter enhydrae]|uniref:site-specific DNA-methyltransferase (adenine-specific) n=1 Tax=Helicobacter enhydrae TaxID=222136 RepID=A0A1B1U3Z6_9HELI|nr:type I restriction-modification system subunit M [Helicobacter enhydrae]ANV97415.1 type I restriction-modification system subunit M [Helicobacter enhydrae]